MSEAITPQPIIRWALERDLPDMLRIERESFPNPWTRDNFIATLRERDCIGMAVVFGDRVLGFVIYEMKKQKFRILNLAVDAAWRHKNIGTLMVKKLAAKLDAMRRNKIVLEVRETNLAAQLFFKAIGFRAVKVVKGAYDDDEDAFLMQYTTGDALTDHMLNVNDAAGETH